jgi:phage tail-like protein
MAVNRYIDYLPAILQQGRFIGPFLQGFERVLSGPPADSTVPPGVTPPEGLEQIVSRVFTFFNPLDPAGAQAPDDFLPWLAGWVATSVEDDWSVATKRAFISRIVQLYKMRGTAAGLRVILDLHGFDPTVYDHDDDATPPYFTDGTSPYLFAVTVSVAGATNADVDKRIRQAISIIDQWKPAHAYYTLDHILTGMQINRDSPTPRLWLDPSFTVPSGDPAFGPGIQIGVNTRLATSATRPTLKQRAMEINDDVSLNPQFGEGIILGVNTVLGTEGQ